VSRCASSKRRRTHVQYQAVPRRHRDPCRPYPDGTTVVDTAKTDAPACDTTAAACAGWNGFPVPPPAGCACAGQQNSYGHLLKKSVNENHQSRIAIFDAQEWPCGVGLETKFSSTTNQDESYVALRLATPILGGHLDNTGTVRGSLRN
jgi:hypothetical protein